MFNHRSDKTTNDNASPPHMEGNLLLCCIKNVFSGDYLSGTNLNVKSTVKGWNHFPTPVAVSV